MLVRAHQSLTTSLVVIAILGFSATALAQFVPGTPYIMLRESHTYVELPSPTVVTMSATSGSFPVALPFSFPFYDTDQTSVSFGVDGAIAFPSGTFISTANSVPGTTSSPAGFIAPLWDNHWVLAATNTLVGYQVQGVAPQRTITFEWRNITTFAATAVRFSFQLRLFEGPSGRIEIDYGPITGAGGWTATMGMEDPSNARPILFAPSRCTTNCTNSDFATNTRISLVQDPGIELFAVSVTPPAIGFLGVTTPVVAQVRNLHATPLGPFTVDIVVSGSPLLTNPVTIGTTQIGLSAFELRDVTIPTLPPTSLPTGSYWVGVVVDSQNVITEVFEDNNTAVSRAQMRLEEGRADLVVERVTTSSNMITAGDSVDVTTRIRNIGGEPAADFDVAVMLSSNAFISTQDLTLDTFRVTLAAGESTTDTRTITIDSGTNSGAYFIGAIADPTNAIPEISESNNGRATDAAITITGGALAIVTPALPDAVLRSTYAAGLTAVGGDPTDRVWEISGGSLPMGLGIVRGSGELFGRPTMVETQTFTVRLTSDGEVATKQLTLAVTDPAEPLTIVTRQIAAGLIGQEYSFPIVVTGGAGTSSITWTASNLPAGFMISEQGRLDGTPIEAGTSTITVTARSGAESDSRDLVLTIRPNANLLIVPMALEPARFGEAYSAQLMSTGGTEPIVFVIESGELPFGITVSPAGAIAGTPAAAGVYRFAVEARDSSPGSPARDVNQFELIVLDDGALMIKTPSFDPAVVGQGFDATIEAEGGQLPYRWTIEEGRIPDGLTAIEDPATNTFKIRGQPTDAGSTNLLLRVTDDQGRSATRAIPLRVLATAPVIPTPVDEGGCTCTTQPATNQVWWLWVGLLVGLGLRRRQRGGRSS